MYSQRLINLENNTQTRAEGLYSDRLLSLERKMEQRISNKNNKDEEPTDFLDELLESAEEIARAAAPSNQKEPEVRVKPEPTANDDEEFDPSFFDGLLQRANAERREDEATIVNVKRERTNNDDCAPPNNKRSKQDSNQNEEPRPRLQIRTDLTSLPTTSKNAVIDPIGKSFLFMDEIMPDETPDVEAINKLTAKEKMSKALERILYARKAFEKEKNQKEQKFYPKNPVFVYTQTVRKLPSSSTHFTQQIYDNRSPLHTVNNVSFSFNSTSTRLNLHDWGLEAPPLAALKVARILCYDAETLYLKRNSIKIPDKIQRNQNATKDINPLFEQSNSTLFINATVQTDEVRIVPIRRGDFYRNVGIQFNPQTFVAGTQTSAAYCGTSASDLPFMRLINNLNENQLQAVDDFVQLITEPVSQAGVDIYEKRSRLQQIYKDSQQPPLYSSMGLAPPPPSMRGFDDSDYNRFELKYELDRDPRFNTQRGRSSPYQGGHLYSALDHSGRSSPPNSSTKYYGRGAKRRN